ncbi:hypothetical protein [Bythopirellula polymerisocia]|uniref:Uncharacterized protein n=1 Tax=Bythopirellula polymerisocia TaxID=2528003 RepID=A0A5C6CSN3_9BACT|nr:hypothetical protein [Bythopirellula polymerisocia]TWU25779.1 hypothetical protein Pla144_29910 [Bythopirellula polymerisocia]
MFHEPAQYGWKVDRKRSIKAYREWAEEAWLRHSGASSGTQSPCDFEAGFKDGFVDYVNFGGNGEPPPVPPRKYWNLAYRIPAGEPSAADWFAGFRYGARVAREEGYREKGVIDSSLFNLGLQKSDSYDNYYPDQLNDLETSDSQAMELLPPGDYQFEPEDENFESEELPNQGPLITQPALDATPNPQAPIPPVLQAPKSKPPAQQSRDPQPSVPQPVAPQPVAPQPIEESNPQSDPPESLEDLFGNRRKEDSSFVSSKVSERKVAAAPLPARSKVKSGPSKDHFIR